MHIVAPYIILHVQLENNAHEQLLISTEDNGYYLVFWWKDIPLGDLYLEAGQLLNTDDLKIKILSRISPAIDYYAAKLQWPEKNYGKSFLSTGKNDFHDLLESINQAYATQSLNENVNISVIICTRNRSSSLKVCLDSLLCQKYKPAEIIVVDNAPSDDETKNLVAQYKTIKYHNEPHKGLDIARNAGAFLASESIIAYVDDDVILHPHWAYEIWRSFKDPAISALTGLVFAQVLDSEAEQIFEKHWSFNRGYIDKLYDKDFFTSSRMPPVWEIGAGASMAFRKSILEKTGYFDERLDAGAAGCNGDSELWYRILLNGYNIIYNPRVISHHCHRAEMHSLKKQIFNYIRGHVVASLIQQKNNTNADYKRYVYRELPKYYLLLLKSGFPSFSSRYCTLFSEIRGWFSGILYFQKHQNNPSQNSITKYLIN